MSSTTVSTSRARGPHAPWPLVGRADELNRIGRSLRSGTVSGVVLIGDAGLGKSRLATECLDLAEQIGFTAKRAVASRSASGIPLGALAPFLPVTPPGSPVQGDLLGWAMATIVEGADGPLLLAIDDAHLLDDASAIVVQQLAANDHAFVVLTIRSGEPCPDAITALWKTGSVERIDVGALGDRDTERLLHEVLGPRIDGGALHSFWNASRGNPLYLREAVLGAIDHGTLVEEGDIWRLSGSVGASPRLAELVEERLAGLAEGEREILEALAVGEPLGPALLAAVGVDTSAAVLERLENRGLLTIALQGQRHVVRLAHPLHGEVLRRRMSSVRSIELNRRLADAVETTGARRREDVLRVAVWRLDGGGRVQPDLMLEAARRAFFALDGPLAERLARAARDADAGIMAGLLLAEVLTGQGKVVEADRVLASLGREASDSAERAYVATSRGSLLFWGLGRVEEALDVLTLAEPEVEPGPWRDEVVSVRAVTTMLAGRPVEAIALAQPILANEPDRAFVQASIAAGTSLAMAGRTDEALAVVDRGLEHHYAIGSQQMLTRPYILENSRATALCEAGRLGEAWALASTGYAASVEHHDAAAQAWFAMMLGKVSMFQGQLEAADRYFAEGAVLYGDLHHHGPKRWCLGGRLIVNTWAGKARVARNLVDDIKATPSPMLFLETEVMRGLAWYEWLTGQPERARTQLRDAASFATQQGTLMLALSSLHDLARLGAASEVVPEMEALGSQVDGELAAARVAFVSALARHDPDALDLSAARFEDLGALLFAAEAAAHAAAAHVQRQSRRRSVVSERNAARLVELCGGARTPVLAALGRASDLTERQLEIAGLAAAGLASKTIAQRLGLSARTVDNHLQRVYQRLGVSSREDLADALAHGGS